MKFLITDPCYVVPKEDWSSFLDATNIGDDLMEGGYYIEGFGRIVQMDGTANGDGSAYLGGGKKVYVDAGLVCVVQLDAGVEPTDYQGNAVTSDPVKADAWYEKAMAI